MKNKFYFLLVTALMFSSAHVFTQWTLVSNSVKSLNSVAIKQGIWGFAVGDSGVIRKTVTGGSTWSIQNYSTLSSFRKTMIFNSDLTFVCGDSGIVIKTTNGGSNWQNISPAGAFNFYDMDFLDLNTGIVVGQQRHFAYTPNAGVNWITGQLNVPGPANLDYTCVDLIDAYTSFVASKDTLIAGNYTVYIHKSTNNGVSYSQVFSYSSTQHCPFIDLQFLNANTGYAAVKNGNVFKTTNGGVNWTTYNITSAYDVNSIFFYNVNTGYACGSNGYLSKTTNGGVNWLSQNSPITTTLNDNFFSDTLKGCSVGKSSMIFTSNGGTFTGVNSNGSEIPGKFSLYQNYPNPFNPVTKISFDIPQQSFTKLSIFNILGEEVSVVLNETIPAGKYEAEFDASGLPSGTYFYRLNSGDYSETRKMILIK